MLDEYFETKKMQKMTFSGVDGCHKGWFVITLFNDEYKSEICEKFEQVVAFVKTSSLTFVDIPIGLIDSGHAERLCDREARKILGFPRSCSVFPAPKRPALKGNNYEECSEINYKVSGTRLTKQTYGIIPKIRQADEYFVKNPSKQDKIRETHPEVCFCAFAERPMKHSKKTEKGEEERIKVLKNIAPQFQEIYSECIRTYLRGDVAKDDILDALIAAVSAKYFYSNPKIIPNETQRDLNSIRMEIAYSKPV